MEKHLKYSCKFPICRNSYFHAIDKKKVTNKHFFKFPHNNSKRLEIWKKFCNIADGDCKNYYLCEDHFEIKQFKNISRSRLNWNAIPSQTLPINNMHNMSVDLSVNSENLDVDSVNMPSDLPIYSVNSDVNNENITIDLSVNSETLDVNIVNMSVDNSDNVNVSMDLPINSEHFHVNNVNMPIDLPINSLNNSSANLSVNNEHNYAIEPVKDNEPSCSENNTHLIGTFGNETGDKFNFLLEKRKGILSKIGIPKRDLSPMKSEMYKVHRNVSSKLSRLKQELKRTKNKLEELTTLYNEGKFKYIDESLNDITKEFIDSQLRNYNKNPHAKRWTLQNKIFALSLYKRSPRLYKYLQANFELPSTRTLKDILSRIPFNTGLNEGIVDILKSEVSKMQSADRNCLLLFDEIGLSKGFYYEQNKERITGYEDLGHLGRNNKTANHALVFMIRGVRRKWKQAIAYYFTNNTVTSIQLKIIIKFIISQLQAIGLNVLGTVCDQASTNQKALSDLCSENKDRYSPFYFYVNNKPICIIYDVPHLLKNTRNCLLRCKIQFETNKQAKFEYIEKSFRLDSEKRTYRMLYKLKPKYFEFKDSYIKMKVKVAAAQLSYTVAASLETWVASGQLPSEAIYTAEFVTIIDQLFDSLNATGQKNSNKKKFRTPISCNSPHIEFWKDILNKMRSWK